MGIRDEDTGRRAAKRMETTQGTRREQKRADIRRIEGKSLAV